MLVPSSISVTVSVSASFIVVGKTITDLCCSKQCLKQGTFSGPCSTNNPNLRYNVDFDKTIRMLFLVKLRLKNESIKLIFLPFP